MNCVGICTLVQENLLPPWHQYDVRTCWNLISQRLMSPYFLTLFDLKLSETKVPLKMKIKTTSFSYFFYLKKLSELCTLISPVWKYSVQK